MQATEVLISLSLTKKRSPEDEAVLHTDLPGNRERTILLTQKFYNNDK